MFWQIAGIETFTPFHVVSAAGTLQSTEVAVKKLDLKNL